MKFSLVDRNNLPTAYPAIIEAIQKSWAIAIDCEFSGLGLEDGATRDQNLEMRYSALKTLVESHTIVSFGICLVNRLETDSGEISFTAENFDFLLLCQQSFKCSPSSLKFLRENGFDFNALIDRGISFRRGSSVVYSDRIKENIKPTEDNRLICSVFEEIIRASVKNSTPILVHNGLLDLMFIYNSFYGPLPPILEAFLADLSEMFAGGVFDTKYLSDYVYHEEISFLEFLYRKYQRQVFTAQLFAWKVKEARPECTPIQLSAAPRISDPIIEISEPLVIKWCESYGYHGHCKNGKQCTESHDIELILDALMKRSAKRKRGSANAKNRKLDAVISIAASPNSTKESINKDNYRLEKLSVPHSAYYDACMTAFVFCRYVFHQERQMAGYDANGSESSDSSGSATEEDIAGSWHTQWKNRIYVIGKQIPILLYKSKFSKTSKHHQGKLNSILDHQ